MEAAVPGQRKVPCNSAQSKSQGCQKHPSTSAALRAAVLSTITLWQFIRAGCLPDGLRFFCLTLPAIHVCLIYLFFFFSGQRCKWKRHLKCSEAVSALAWHDYYYCWWAERREKIKLREYIQYTKCLIFFFFPIVLHPEMAAGRIKHPSQHMQDAHRFSTNSVETSFVFCLWFTGALSFLVVDTRSIFSSILTAVTNN